MTHQSIHLRPQSVTYNKKNNKVPQDQYSIENHKTA